MSKLRYGLGLYAGKAVRLGLKVLKRQGTYMPGVIAARIDPDYLDHLPKPGRIIAVTGTNGKTTTSNMLLDILSQKHRSVVNNNIGSNTDSGIITTLADNVGLTGQKKSDLAVLEVDERWTPIIFRSVKPDVLVITNLYQDSYKRNAHTDFIRDTIDGGLPRETRLVLNADDLISSQIGEGNERVFFSIAPQEGEPERRDSRLKDIRYCPRCGAPLVWDFVRYHHIGKARCEACGFTNQEAKYIVQRVDEKSRTIHLTDDGSKVELPLILGTTEAIYNQLAAYSALREFGMAAGEIREAMRQLKVVTTRFNHTRAGGKNIYLFCAKRMNPIANSRVFDAIKKHPGNKTVIVASDDHQASRYDENLSWFYDTDFEYLADESLNRLIIDSWRHNDLMVRALMAGVPEEKIHAFDDDERVPDLVDLDEPGDIFILHGIHIPSRTIAERISAELAKRLEAKQ